MRRAILEVRTGPLTGTKAVLSAGQRLSVGRKPLADLVINDDQLSGVHFELGAEPGAEGDCCKLTDLDSRTGTWLGGERIQVGEARHGAWIRAGGTDFTLSFEAVTAPTLTFEQTLETAEEDELGPLAVRWLKQNREPRRRAAEALAARREETLRAFEAADGPRYAVLDAARTDRILVLLKESVETCRSLYEGLQGESLAHVAPYLVELPQGSGLLRRLVNEGWKQRWGIYIDYPHSFKELRRHLRRLLMVSDPDTRKSFYFRFYDPVVLDTFIPTCTVRQRAELFGEIKAFLVEGRAGEIIRHPAEVP
jgi:pSer/pThr/pTyr-binding forkhead associated (FHA) protein